MNGLVASKVRVVLVAPEHADAERMLSAAPDFTVRSVRGWGDVPSAITEVTPDALIVVLTTPTADDAQTLRQLLRGLRAPCMVISAPAEDERVVAMIKAGAAGYLFDRDAGYLATAVRELVRGGAPMSAPISRLVMQRARRSSATMAAVRPNEETAATLLTPRQREILKLLQLGHSYDDIGVALNLSINTVRSHVRVIYDRLGAASKVEAVMIALELGILERPRISEPPRPLV